MKECIWIVVGCYFLVVVANFELVWGGEGGPSIEMRLFYQVPLHLWLQFRVHIAWGFGKESNVELGLSGWKRKSTMFWDWWGWDGINGTCKELERKRYTFVKIRKHVRNRARLMLNFNKMLDPKYRRITLRKYKKITRMHYSRMRTVRCSGCLEEGCLPGGIWGVSAQRGVHLPLWVNRQTPVKS